MSQIQARINWLFSDSTKSRLQILGASIQPIWTVFSHQPIVGSRSLTNKVKQIIYCLVPLAGCLPPAPVLAQERFYEWGWGMHPMMWGAWGLGMMFMMVLFWALLIVGTVLVIRWLVGQGRENRTDSALEILRQRYARGEINKEEFETKKKDLTV